MKDLKLLKKEIALDWEHAFPELTVFTSEKLYKILGCLVIGIELIKLPRTDAYRPHFVVYPLWKIDVKDCLNAPTILIQIYDNGGLQFSIPYDKHKDYFTGAVECVKKQVLISINGNIAFKSLNNMIDSRFNDILIKSNSAQQAKLYELKLYAALYSDKDEQIQYVLKQIQNQRKSWNMQIFEIWFGKFDKWIDELQDRVKNRVSFLKQIDINRNEKKLSVLKVSEILP